MSDDEILKFFSSNGKITSKRTSKGYICKYNPNLLDILYNRFSDTTHDTPIIEILYRIKNGIEEVPKCPICGNPIKYTSGVGYFTYCSQACSKSPEALERWKKKTHETMQQRYGVTYALQSQELKQKQIDGLIKKYGVINVFQREDVKKQIQETCIQRYGVSHPCKSDEVKQKIINTNYLRYYCGTPDAEKLQEQRLQKSVKTCFDHYGVEHPLQSNILLSKRIIFIMN